MYHVIDYSFLLHSLFNCTFNSLASILPINIYFILSFCYFLLHSNSHRKYQDIIVSRKRKFHPDRFHFKYFKVLLFLKPFILDNHSTFFVSVSSTPLPFIVSYYNFRLKAIFPNCNWTGLTQKFFFFPQTTQ